jgi:trk system potassium uptake protein TrkA
VRIVIIGAGKVGTFIAADLIENGHDVTVVERDPLQVDRRRPTEGLEGVDWVVADACEVSELSRARLERADVVLAVTGDDEDNLVTSLLAKQEFGVPRVIARVNHPANEWMFTEMWGVDIAVSAPHLLSALVEEAVTVGSMVRLLQVAGGRARLIEVTLTADSPILGRSVPARLECRRHRARGRCRRAPWRHRVPSRRRGPGTGVRRVRGRSVGAAHPTLTVELRAAACRRG